MRIPTLVIIIIIISAATYYFALVYKCNTLENTIGTKLDNNKLNGCILNFLNNTLSYLLILFGLFLDLIGFFFLVLERQTKNDYERGKDRNFAVNWFTDEQFKHAFWLILFGSIFQFIGTVLQFLKAI